MSQDRRQLLVARSDPYLRVDDEEHEVGLGDRGTGLFPDLLYQRRGIGDVDAARVDEQEPVAGPLAQDFLAIAGHSGCLVDDGCPRAREPVDEHREGLGRAVVLDNHDEWLQHAG